MIKYGVLHRGSQEKLRKDCYNGDVQTKMDKIYVQSTQDFKDTHRILKSQMLF